MLDIRLTDLPIAGMVRGKTFYRFDIPKNKFTLDNIKAKFFEHM